MYRYKKYIALIMVVVFLTGCSGYDYMLIDNEENIVEVVSENISVDNIETNEEEMPNSSVIWEELFYEDMINAVESDIISKIGNNHLQLVVQTQVSTNKIYFGVDNLNKETYYYNIKQKISSILMGFLLII